MALFAIQSADGSNVLSAESMAVVVATTPTPPPVPGQWSANQILIVGDSPQKAVTISTVSGAIVDTIVSPTLTYLNFFYSAVLNNYTFASQFSHFATSHADTLAISDPTFALLANVDVFPIPTYNNNHQYPVASDFSTTFYYGHSGQATPGPPSFSVFASVSPTGTVGTIHTLPYHTLSGMAVNTANTILYYIEDDTSNQGTYPNLTPIHRWDLVNNVALADLTPGVGTASYGPGLWFLPGTGTLLVPYQPDRAVDDWQVRELSATDGSVIATVDVGAMDGLDLAISIDVDTPTTYWVASTPDFHFVTFTQYTGGSATAGTAFTLANGSADGEVPNMTGAGFYVRSGSTPPIPSTTYPVRRLRRFAL